MARLLGVWSKQGGGLVRDEHGNWVAGFTRHIGTTNIFAAELWGLRDGLLLCRSLNISSYC